MSTNFFPTPCLDNKFLYIQNFKLYKTVDLVFQISFPCRRTISKMNTYSIIQLRFSIFCWYLLITVSLFSSRPMLKVNYLTPLDREFCALCFHNPFKVPGVAVKEKMAWNWHLSVFLSANRKIIFSKPRLARCKIYYYAI